MKSKIFLKEKAVHGTALIPIAIYHLSYDKGIKNYFYLHWHDEFEFVLVMKGAIQYTIEDKKYNIKEGEGLFIHPNKLHCAGSYNGMPCEACVLLFHPNIFGGGEKNASYLKFVYPILNGEIFFDNYFRLENKWQKSVLDCIREIDKLKDKNLSDYELLLKSGIFKIWHLCYTNSAAAALNKKGSDYKLGRLQPVLDYIEKNYKKEISLIKLANILPMSKGQFCHTFKEVMHISPIAYVIRCRILKSCTLLTGTDFEIANIARSVGFNNISYFNHEFKKAIGCSPKMYRNES